MTLAQEGLYISPDSSRLGLRRTGHHSPHHTGHFPTNRRRVGDHSAIPRRLSGDLSATHRRTLPEKLRNQYLEHKNFVESKSLAGTFKGNAVRWHSDRSHLLLHLLLHLHLQ